MAFLTLFRAASVPILQVLLVSMIGACMATEYLNLLTGVTQKSLSKIVFMVLIPSHMFASLTDTITVENLVKWWFMPVNIGLTFLFGGILGWLTVKILKPESYLEGLVIATCSSGNLSSLLLIIVPAICSEDASPFGDQQICSSVGSSYASFSMAVGSFYIWTYTYQLVRKSALKYRALEEAEVDDGLPENCLGHSGDFHLLEGDSEKQVAIATAKPTEVDTGGQAIKSGEPGKLGKENSMISQFWRNLAKVSHQLVEDILTSPIISAIVGFLFGAIPWMKKLIIGDNAPLRVIQDSSTLLGDAATPCITLILGSTLMQGFRQARLKPVVIFAVICVRYVFLPIIGIGVVKAATSLGFLSSDPLYHYVLMIQFAVPPSPNISTMTQLFDVAKEECSVLFLWTYLVALLSLTLWSTVYMSILS